MPEPLTSRQREILEYLRFRQKIRSYPPTVREIGEAVGLSSSSTVQNHLNTLERKGYIRRDPTKSRTIEVVDIDELQPSSVRSSPCRSWAGSRPVNRSSPKKTSTIILC